MRRALTSLALVAAVAATGFLLTTRPGAQGARRGPGMRVLTVGDLRTFRLPLDRYRLSPEQARTVSRVRDILFVGCMRRFGFDLEAPAGGGSVPYVGNEQRYGVDDEAQARKHGYHPPKPPTPSPDGEPSLAPAAEAVADGSGAPTYKGRRVPAGGCLGHALRELNRGGPVPADPGLAERLALESYVASSEVGPMRAVFARWSACMRRAGFAYANPRKANNDPAFRTSRSSGKEIATAVADVRCKREADLVDAWATAETAYQQYQVARYRDQLEIQARALETGLRNAERILARGSHQV